MRGIACQFATHEILSLELEAGGDEQDLELPADAPPLSDGDWVLAQITVGDETTEVAACAVDRGDGLRLAFEDRDWQRLWTFANSQDPPTIPPPTLPPSSGRVATPMDVRVLVVDADRDTQLLLKKLLDSTGYITSLASSAEHALDRLRDMPIDLVVIDWNLPGMAGAEFCRRSRRTPGLARLPIVFLTSNVSSKDVVAAFEAGADDFLPKPFRAPELKARILGILRRSKMQPHKPSR